MYKDLFDTASLTALTGCKLVFTCFLATLFYSALLIGITFFPDSKVHTIPFVSVKRFCFN